MYGIDPKMMGIVSGWFFLHSLLHFVPVFPLDRKNSEVKNFEMCQWPYFSTWGHVYLLDLVSSGSISTLLGITAKVNPIGF